MQNNPSVYSNLNPGVAKYVNDAWKVKGITSLLTIHYTFYNSHCTDSISYYSSVSTMLQAHRKHYSYTQGEYHNSRNEFR
jgi:hypothetical protein